EPADEFPAFMDFDSFLQEPTKPLPERPQVLFVGVLERYKNVDGLADAWRLAAPRVPGAQLRLVGAGTLQPVVEQLLRDVPGRARGMRAPSCGRAPQRSLRPVCGRWSSGSLGYASSMRAERIKQVLKNSVYRTLGETAQAIGANGNGHRTLRVLMYHKVNDLPGNPLTMPVSLFDEQMDQVRELGYTVVDLDAVLAHYVEGKPLPERAVLITFDDGYHDNLENAARVLRKYGYPAVLFVPIGYLGDPLPLPHEERLAAQGILNRTIDWDEVVELEREGVRIES